MTSSRLARFIRAAASPTSGAGVFLARLIELGQPDRHEAVRRIDVLGVENFRRKVAAGESTDGPTLAAYTQAAARGLL